MFKNIKKVMKYLVVLFKNKEKKRIIKKFKTYDRAISFFNQKINNNIVFDKRVENGRPCSFELGLLEKDSKNFELYFVKDELGLKKCPSIVLQNGRGKLKYNNLIEEEKTGCDK
jgi:hypothetical protein